MLKVNGIWNFAQAGMMVVAYGSMYASTRWLDLGLLPAFALGLAGTVAMSLALERFGFRPLRRRGSSSLTFFVFTLVVSQLCTYVAELILVPNSTTLIDDVVTPVSLIGNVAVSAWDLRATTVTLLLVMALALFLKLPAGGSADRGR